MEIVKLDKITYRPEIDGLRALSVLAVILFHFSPKLIPGGFIGVDVFFVISGYLITSIIIASHQLGQPWLKTFWVRRLRRIFPALAVMIILVLLFVTLIGLPSLVTSTGKQALSVSAFLGNFRLLAITGDYWGPTADYTVLLHTWSLAVEEQFYFIYPLILVVILSYSTIKILVRSLVILFFLSLWWCIHQTDNNQAQAFYLLPSRAWELIAGAIIALTAKKIHQVVSTKAAQVLASLGLFVILISLFLLPGVYLFPGKIALIPIGGAVLFILFSSAGGFFSQILSQPPVLFIGRASYSLYLWHWPMLVIGLFFADFFEFEAFRTVGILLGIGLGFASYQWIEPLGKSPRFLKLYAPIAAGLLILFSVSASWGYLNIYPEKFKRDAEGHKFDVRNKPRAPFWRRALRSVIKPNEVGLKTPQDVSINPTGVKVLLIGDSHAIALANNIDSYVKGQGFESFIYASSGMPLTSISQPNLSKSEVNKIFYDTRLKLIKDLSPEVILIVARWSDVKTFEELKQVENLISTIHLLTPKSNIIIIGQPPVIDYARLAKISTHEWINWRYRLGNELTLFPVYVTTFTENAHQYFKYLANNRNYIKFIPVADLFPVSNGQINVLRDNKLLYDDGNHLSETGSKLVTDKIAPAILEAVKKIPKIN